jgi:hypothetical protein
MGKKPEWAYSPWEKAQLEKRKARHAEKVFKSRSRAAKRAAKTVRKRRAIEMEFGKKPDDGPACAAIIRLAAQGYTQSYIVDQLNNVLKLPGFRGKRWYETSITRFIQHHQAEVNDARAAL